MPRWLITLILVFLAVFITWGLVAPRGTEPQDKNPTTDTAPPQQSGETDPPPAPANAVPEQEVREKPADATTVTEAPAAPVGELRIVKPTETQIEPVIGNADRSPNSPYAMSAKFTPFGAGIYEVNLSRYSKYVVLDEDDFEPYPIQQRQPYPGKDGTLQNVFLYPMASHSITINGQTIPDLNWAVWRYVPFEDPTLNTRKARFVLEFADAQDRTAVRLTRIWSIEPRPSDDAADRYVLTLQQKITNLTAKPLSVRFNQYGPMDLIDEAGYIGGQRHAVMAYHKPRLSGKGFDISVDGTDLPRSKVLKDDDGKYENLWPAADVEADADLLWSGMTNRYFASILFVPPDQNDKMTLHPLQSLFPVVRRERFGTGDPVEKSLALLMEGAPVTLSPTGASGDATNLDLQIFLGPKSPRLLDQDPEFSAMRMDHVIVYNLGGCCATCTFEPLGVGLLKFLSLLDWIVRDWGFSIILLVAVVRTLLHPLTKGAQVKMMKLSKQMQSLQPEIEKLKAKYKDDQQKFSQEMWALYRERGVNPLSMGGGCLPMFLQMPIWVALYAMLYFAIELRHEPAFWGIFQGISGGRWPFLADLSVADRFIPLPEAMQFTVPLIGQEFASINLLPLLMGFVFFVQQKYMTPPPSPNMSPEMRQQQVMMKWMMVVLFPIMLYWAPSGLTLYILTSTGVGIIESKRVRAHVKELEDSGKLHEPKARKEGGFFDRMMKAAEQHRKEMEKQQQKQQRSGKGRKRN